MFPCLRVDLFAHLEERKCDLGIRNPFPGVTVVESLCEINVIRCAVVPWPRVYIARRRSEHEAVYAVTNLERQVEECGRRAISS